MKNHIIIILIFFTATSTLQSQNIPDLKDKIMSEKKIVKTDQEWKAILSEEEFRILRNKGTEYPHTGKYNLHFENGVYNCNGCNTPLFESNQKFESDCGWPSFDDAIDGAVKYVDDFTHNMVRTEIVCVKCDGHLGHVFDDGPTETGKRYCVNSISIDFKKNSNKK
jgi:peptide-methionine (R)-S-oxide reductase